MYHILFNLNVAVIKQQQKLLAGIVLCAEARKALNTSFVFCLSTLISQYQGYALYLAN
jgi:hypothetical protein